MPIDLAKFTGTLPYDSQMFGIYQPLLGWKSSLQVRRLDQGLSFIRQRYLGSLTRKFVGRFSIQNAVADAPQFTLDIGQLVSAVSPVSIEGVDSLVARRVVAAVSAAGANDPAQWKTFTSADYLRKALQEIQPGIKSELLARARSSRQPDAVLASILDRESVAAAVLNQINTAQSPDELFKTLARVPTSIANIAPILALLDPQSDMAGAALAPLGLVHLFREYFFEFATFLGTPVQHVWLSPGGTVELVEISTRKTMVERSIEQAVETIDKSEKDTTTQDELSDAVRQENSSDTKLGVSATSNTNYTVGFVSGSVSVTGSYDAGQQQKQAREQTHKTTRQQTQKLSSEIRQSFKSTFKTVTETTDTTSKRYVLQNSTDKLVNYELRRKMRQVGVQLQDYGTRLCWQAFVDNPGDALGVPIFVHAAAPPDLQDIQAPEMPPPPDPIVRGDAIVIRGGWDHGDNSQHNLIPIGNPVSIVPPPGYVCFQVDVSCQQGPAWYYRAWPESLDAAPLQVLDEAGPRDAKAGYVKSTGDPDPGKGTLENTIALVLAGVQAAPGGLRDSNHYDIALQITPVFRPSLALLKGINDNYNQSMAKYNQQTKLAYQQSLYQSVRERVKLASNIQPRSFDELREEERIVVFRQLVRQLLEVAGITSDDHRVRHVFSEVVESMFDMDNMLYFVAPDWWMPRAQVSSADALAGLGISASDDAAAFTPGSPGSSTDVVGWGGARAVRADNYYITEDSAAAKLGSSLGWLIQLDGDNFRNAFLNAPWVKSVIPIREGHEWKALQWLSSPSVEGADGLDALYQEAFPGEKANMLAVLQKNTNWPDSSLAARYAGLNADQLTILDAIRYLVVVIQAKQAAGEEKTPPLTYLPPDKVFEFGFDPLQNGFVAQATVPFEVFDQWIEVLPTDQIVPVEVTYDPKTGQQI